MRRPGLRRVASRTGWLGYGEGRAWGDLVSRWDRLFGEGMALARLEHGLNARTSQEWREIIRATELAPESLLWQGRKRGFAVATRHADCRDTAAAAIPILLLRAEKREAKFAPSYLLPVRLLLQAVLENGEALAGSDAEILGRFVTEIEHGIAGKN